MINVAIFASGTGSNFQNLIEHMPEGATISLLVVDRTCNAEQIAIYNEIPHVKVFEKDSGSKRGMEEQINTVLMNYKIDLIVLAGYMRLFSSWFVNKWDKRMINIHPSLLPLYKGKHAIEQSVEAGLYQYGVTVHYVNEGKDEGEIISQQRVAYKGLDLETVEKLIHQAEYQLYPKAIQKVIDEGVETK